MCFRRGEPFQIFRGGGGFDVSQTQGGPHGHAWFVFSAAGQKIIAAVFDHGGKQAARGENAIIIAV